MSKRSFFSQDEYFWRERIKNWRGRHFFGSQVSLASMTVGTLGFTSIGGINENSMRGRTFLGYFHLFR